MLGANRHRKRLETLAPADDVPDTGDWEQVAEDCRKALRRNGRDARLLIRYGIALKTLNDLPAAEIALRGAIAADPAIAEAHQRLGELLIIENRADEAAASFRRALALDGSLMAVSRTLADLDRQRAMKAVESDDEDDRRPDAGGKDEPRKQLVERSGLFDEAWYLERYPEAAETGMSALDHYLAFGWAEGLEPGPLTDAAGYLARYPEVAAAQSNPLLHFILAGAFQGRSCLTGGYERELILGSTLFDAAWYQANNPDIGPTDALDHYIDTGAAEGRAPGPLFDARDYLRRNPRVAAARGNPLLQYILCGAGRGRAVRSVDREAEKALIAASGCFDRRAYRAAYRDVATGDLDPLDHYIAQGAAEGRSSGSRFDAAGYLARTPDVAAAGANPLFNHLLAEALRCPIRLPDRSDEKSIIVQSELFDPAWYLKRRPEAGKRYADPLDHYLDCPAAEASPPCADFDTRDYLARYPEIAQAGFEPLLHYIVLGTAEHRMIFSIERSRDRAIIAASTLFDADWYRHTYSDVAAAGLDPIDHYIGRGARQGRNPGPHFDAGDYVEKNPDVSAANANPLLHYLAVGKAEGRRIRSLGRRRRRALRVWSGWPAGPD